METKAAKIISHIFHPLLMPFYAFILLLNLQAYFAIIIPASAKWHLAIFIFLITFVFPFLVILFFLKQRLIKSMHMQERSERYYPFAITGIFYFIGYFLLKSLKIASVYHYFSLGSATLVLMALLINFYWKISIHMIALGGVFGMLLGLGLSFTSLLQGTTLYPLINACLLIAGITGFARLQLNSHTPAQIYAGFLLGLAVMLGFSLYF